MGEMCHFIDLAAYLAGQPPRTVFAVSADLDKSPALTDSVTATLTFADGSVATVTYVASGDTSYPKERVEVFCGGRVWVIDDFRSLMTAAGGKVRSVRLKSVDKGHREELRAFVDLALGAPASILSFADCVASTAATFKVIESLSSGQRVSVPLVETTH